MKKVQRSQVRSVMNYWQPPPTSSLVGCHSTTFGSFVRQLRLERRLSRAHLANRTGVQEGALEKMESNQAVPSCQDIKKLAPALNVPEQALMEAAGYLKRSTNAAP